MESDQDRIPSRIAAAEHAIVALARNSPGAMAINYLEAEALPYIDHPMKKTSDQ